MIKNRIDFKVENKPRTVIEKYNKLRFKNPNIDLLKKTLDLKVAL